MAYAFVAGTSGIGNGVSLTTSAIDTTGADTLFVFIAETSAAVDPTWTDSKGNTWTALTQRITPGGEKGQWFYAKAAIVGSGHTITISAGNLPSAVFLAFSGGHTTAPFDAETYGDGFGTTMQPGSITPSVDGCLILQGDSFNTSSTASINLSYLSAGYQDKAVDNTGIAAAYLIQTTAAATNPTWTHSPATAVTAVAAVFKAATGGASLAIVPPSAGTPTLTAIVTVTGTAATGGAAPYTYQWYRATSTGFTPGGGNILAGKTSLVLNDTGLTPGATYYYRLRATDSASATADSAEVSVAAPSGSGGASILLIGP